MPDRFDLRRTDARASLRKLTDRWKPYLCTQDLQLLERATGETYQRLSKAENIAVKRIVERCTSEQFEFLALHGKMIPPMTREVMAFVVFQGLSRKETARAMGVSEAMVREHAAEFRGAFYYHRANQ